MEIVETLHKRSGSHNVGLVLRCSRLLSAVAPFRNKRLPDVQRAEFLQATSGCFSE
jgi:hypothetical protein